MITINKALALAENKLKELALQSSIKLAIMSEETIAFEEGWMFFYQSEAFIKTGNEDEMVGGNAPIIIDKYNESVHITGTSRDEDFYIEKYRQYRETPDIFHQKIR
ncbi:MAG TPA: hypothetical protein DCS93_05170 [Microscillaceae bacterium]|nr:hypothetical protein [Microscillaceae bacterium]